MQSRKQGLKISGFHDLRHNGLPGIIRRARCDELKDLGCWKSRNMVDRYAKFTTENLAFAASRIESTRDSKIIPLSRSATLRMQVKRRNRAKPQTEWLPDQGSNPGPAD